MRYALLLVEFHNVYMSLKGASWSTRRWRHGPCDSAGQEAQLEPLPMLPQREEKERESNRPGNAGTGLHQRGDKVGSRRDKDEQDSHERQHHANKLPEQGTGISILHTLQLNYLLLLLLQLQLTDTGQAWFHCLLHTHTQIVFLIWINVVYSWLKLRALCLPVYHGLSHRTGTPPSPPYWPVPVSGCSVHSDVVLSDRSAAPPDAHTCRSRKFIFTQCS